MASSPFSFLNVIWGRLGAAIVVAWLLRSLPLMRHFPHEKWQSWHGLNNAEISSIQLLVSAVSSTR